MINQILTGDARQLAEAIPDASVDLILCDPVYWEIDDYRWLASLGRRVLKPYRYCIAQVGAYYLFQAMNAMAEHLDYYWLIQEPLSHAAVFFDRKIAQFTKPYLWFANGLEHCPKWRGYALDRVESPKDKRHHAWGDGVGSYAKIIQRLTKPGDLILDPFAGGGTVPVACKILQRNFIAFEIKPSTAEAANLRLYQTLTPWFLPEPQQLAMEASV
jgi:DNA modification methylase